MGVLAPFTRARRLKARHPALGLYFFMGSPYIILYGICRRHIVRARACYAGNAHDGAGGCPSVHAAPLFLINKRYPHPRVSLQIYRRNPPKRFASGQTHGRTNAPVQRGARQTRGSRTAAGSSLHGPLFMQHLNDCGQNVVFAHSQTRSVRVGCSRTPTRRRHERS